MNFDMIILKSKYQNSAKLCFMNTDSLIILMQTEDFYEDIANHVKKVGSNCEVERSFPRGMNKNVVGLMKD